MAQNSLLSGDFQIQSRVPSAAGIPALNDASAILSRNSGAVFYPQSSQTQTILTSSVGNPFQFRISSSRDVCDLRSARLNFSVAMANTAGAGSALMPDQSGLSFVSRVRVLASGQLLSDTDNAAILAALQHSFSYGGNSTVEPLIAGWKYNVKDYGAQSLTTPYSLASANARGLLAANANNNAVANTLQLSLPLRMLSSFFNQAHFWPLRNSSLIVEVYLNAPETAMVSVGTVAATAPSYTISNTQVRMDLYSLQSEIVEMYDSIVGMGPGVVIPFETTECLNSTFSLGGQQSLSFNRAVSDMLEIIAAAAPIASRTDVTRYSISGLPLPGLNQQRLTIGSLNFPVVPIDSDSERIYSTIQCFNGDPTMELSQFALPKTCLTCYANAYTANALTAESDMVQQPICTNLRKISTQDTYFLSIGQPTSLDGGQFTLTFQTVTPPPTVAVPMFMYCFVRFVRLATISSGRISVSA